MLEKNYVDEILNAEYDIDEVKLYPGSDKGPLPTDDPETYSRWFADNQPKKALSKANKQIDFSELGIRSRILAMTKIDAVPNEDKTMIGYTLEEDEEYPLANYSGAPEFSFNDRE